MVISDHDFGSVTVPHKGRIVDSVIEASYKVLRQSTLGIETAQRWQQLQLTDQQQQALAIGAHHVRFADSEGNIDTPIRPDQLLGSKRDADNGSDLWRVFNRIQENALRGGLSARQAAASGNARRPRWVTSREVNGIDQNVSLNKALWELGLEMETLASRN